LNEEELEIIKEAQRKSGTTLMVGFNRRFSPLSTIKSISSGNGIFL
jgi:predicted dehydrogenase